MSACRQLKRDIGLPLALVIFIALNPFLRPVAALGIPNIFLPSPLIISHHPLLKNDRALINPSRWLIEMMYDSHLFSLIPRLLEPCNCMIN